jgi:hypothetical protein
VLDQCQPGLALPGNQRGLWEQRRLLDAVAAEDTCISEGHWLSAPVAVEPRTRTARVCGQDPEPVRAQVAGQPYGFVAKIPKPPIAGCGGREEL